MRRLLLLNIPYFQVINAVFFMQLNAAPTFGHQGSDLPDFWCMSWQYTRAVIVKDS